METWQRRPYVGQWSCVGIAALIAGLLVSGDQWTELVWGLSYFWLLGSCAAASFIHGVYPSVATWWLVSGTFGAFCGIIAIDLAHRHIFLATELPTTSTEHLMWSFVMLLAFAATGIVTLLQFRRTMLTKK